MTTDFKLFFKNLWQDYIAFNPHAKDVYNLLVKQGEKMIINDHIALRTFDDPRIHIEVLAKQFRTMGYEEKADYEFPEKKLYAKHYEHQDDEWQPKIFISQLTLKECSQDLQRKVENLIEQIPEDYTTREDLVYSGRPWQVAFQDYESLRKESEYAAWVAAFGFRPNHFTVFVNALKTFHNLGDLNAFLKNNGFVLNDSGGEIKGSPEMYLEQSSTRAGEVEVDFSDGKYKIPACYYEFAKRFPLPNGKLYQGFVAQSADKIFESTDPVKS